MKTKQTQTGFIKFLLVTAFTLVVISGCSKERIIPVGEKTQHDDFFYTIEKVEKTGMLGGQKKASGVFYIVSFNCRNNAKRVEHTWKNDVAFITDNNGNIYENDIVAQKTLNQIRPFGFKESYTTKAGESESTVMVFDVPVSISEPCIKFRGDFLMGDLFDGNQFKNTKVKLF